MPPGIFKCREARYWNEVRVNSNYRYANEICYREIQVLFLVENCYTNEKGRWYGSFFMTEVFMGIYLNPGNDMFAETVRGEIYVDKTGLIGQINAMVKTPQKFICISRPRRFGKSTAAYMLAAYYEKGCDHAEYTGLSQYVGVSGRDDRIGR